MRDKRRTATVSTGILQPTALLRHVLPSESCRPKRHILSVESALACLFLFSHWYIPYLPPYLRYVGYVCIVAVLEPAFVITKAAGIVTFGVSGLGKQDPNLLTRRRGQARSSSTSAGVHVCLCARACEYRDVCMYVCFCPAAVCREALKHLSPVDGHFGSGRPRRGRQKQNKKQRLFPSTSSPPVEGKRLGLGLGLGLGCSYS
ncbi:hypothetical protein F4813DRAFT_347847 [Daldinia decipiens]|uniref:uncharacterized protein n=1 Tax=Daldinia decipiens TaxID=326647 RepID=UPI0020C35A5E|nr:uncharacterized protein F4813DRAFT_347847 [Daldinia decipiens]KAI1661500.1 hypothetical protein F4813DRAFT_347847 [Daldinia decipiens]